MPLSWSTVPLMGTPLVVTLMVVGWKLPASEQAVVGVVHGVTVFAFVFGISCT